MLMSRVLPLTSVTRSLSSCKLSHSSWLDAAGLDSHTTNKARTGYFMGVDSKSINKAVLAQVLAEDLTSASTGWLKAPCASKSSKSILNALMPSC